MAISLSGSLQITGSIFAIGGITGSFSGTATSASYATNADLLDNRDSTTFANTGSNAFAGSQNINGNVAITGSLTTTGTIIAQTLNVQQVTSSIIYSSGSNVFGNLLSNTQSMTGSVGITGSLAVAGAATFSGLITSTIGVNNYLKASNASTDGLFIENQNNGNISYYGINNSAGSLFFTNSTAYSTNIGTASARDFHIGTNGVVRLTIASTGAATFSSSVTGVQGIFSASAGTYVGGSLILKSSTGTNPIYLTSNGGYFALSNGGGGDHLLITSTGAATFSAGVGINGATLQTGLGAGLTIEGGTYAPLYFSNSGTLRGYLTAYSGGLILASSTAPLTLNNTAYNVLIGTTTDSGYKLDVVGTFRATGAATFSTILNTSGRVSNAHTLGNMQEWVGNFSVNNGASISLFNINNIYDIISGDINMFIDLGGFYGYSTRFLMGYTVSSSLTLDSTISGIGGVSFTAGGTLYNETMTFTNNTGTNGNFRICIRVWGYGVNTSVATGGANLLTSSYLTRIK
jgi:hypothetical protein